MSNPICFATLNNEPSDDKEEEMAVVGWVQGRASTRDFLMAIVMKDGVFFEIRADMIKFKRWA